MQLEIVLVRKVAVICSPQESSILLAIVGWISLPYQTWIPSYWVDLKSKSTDVGYTHNISANIVPLGITWLAYDCYIL